MNKLTIRKEEILEAFVFLIAVFLCFPLILDVLSGRTISNQGKANKTPTPTPVPKEPKQQKDDVMNDLDALLAQFEEDKKYFD